MDPAEFEATLAFDNSMNTSDAEIVACPGGDPFGNDLLGRVKVDRTYLDPKNVGPVLASFHRAIASFAAMKCDIS